MAKPNGASEGSDRSEGLTIFESKLINLLALLLVQERQQDEQMGLLARAGFGPSEIAALVGTTPNAVSVELYKQRRGKKPKKAKNAREK